MSPHFPLIPGQRGEAVSDLQRRLSAASHPPERAVHGEYCSATEAAVRGFQTARGLHPTGVCDEDTWDAIVEASWRLGDRMIMLVAPNQRGDDVAELQSSLSQLGFDSGRVDGIFGPATAHAVQDFQENSGLAVDGVCGPKTIVALHSLSQQTGTGPGIMEVRELASLNDAARTLADMSIVVGQFGGLSPLARQLTRALRARSAHVLVCDEPDAATHASMANHFDANVYVGFEVGETTALHYYSVPKFESRAGRLLAEQLSEQCAARQLTWGTDVVGMRLAILRATRMPAVLMTLDDPRTALDHSRTLVEAVVDALEAWGSGRPTDHRVPSR